MLGKHEMQSSVSLYFLSACSGRFLSALQQNLKKKTEHSQGFFDFFMMKDPLNSPRRT